MKHKIILLAIAAFAALEVSAARPRLVVNIVVGSMRGEDLDRYAETRQWDMDDTLLRGTFFRLLFGRRQQFKKRFRERKLAAAGKKQG